MEQPRMTLFAGLALVALVAATDLSGRWEVQADFDDSNISGGGFDCALKQDGNQLTGNCSEGTASLTGKVTGQDVSWRVKGRNAEAITFTGTIDEAGTTIRGRFAIGDKAGGFTAVRQ